MEKPQELSGKSCPREVPREIRLSRGKSDFPEGRSPEGKSDYPRDLPWTNSQTIPKAFPQLVRLQASKTEESVGSEHVPSFPQGSLTVLNPDFGF